MKNTMLPRLLAIGLIAIVLLVCLANIGSVVEERQKARDGAVESIAAAAGRSQRITGPLLIIPVTQTNASTSFTEIFHVLPEKLRVTATIVTEPRSRGIYETRLFRTHLVMEGEFVVPAGLGYADATTTLQYDPGRIAVGVSDIRGIGTGLEARIGGEVATLEPGAATRLLAAGVHANLPVLVRAVPGARIPFTVTLPIQGTGELRVTPVGRETTVDLRSTWPHPSFTGELLPTNRRVSASGFEAQWQTSFFATNLQELTEKCERREDCRSIDAPAVGVSFIEPVDQYLKSERALKYSVLFIGLTFAGFLLCEVLKGAGLHPLHYGLVGLALALFYLLLLSLAEHIGFGLAYAISAAACVALLTGYLGKVLSNRPLGLGFGGGFSMLYALLFGILSSEDYALLMGTLLLFALLAAFMFLTRSVDWSRPGRAQEET